MLRTLCILESPRQRAESQTFRLAKTLPLMASRLEHTFVTSAAPLQGKVFERLQRLPGSTSRESSLHADNLPPYQPSELIELLTRSIVVRIHICELKLSSLMSGQRRLLPAVGSNEVQISTARCDEKPIHPSGSKPKRVQVQNACTSCRERKSKVSSSGTLNGRQN